MCGGGPESCALTPVGLLCHHICDALFAAFDPHRYQAGLSSTTSAAEGPAATLEKTYLARSMRIELLNRFSSICLAALLQFTPLARVFLAHSNAPLSAWVLTIRWILLGSGFAAAGHQAVSGASSIIVSSLTAKATNGIPFKYRIFTSPYVANAFDAIPMPPHASLPLGVVLEPGSRGIIDGTPHEEGTWSIQLTASDAHRVDRTTYATLVLTVIPNPNQPPTLTLQPKSVTVTNGSSALLNGAASRVSALGYQWLFNEVALPGANTSALAFPFVSFTNAGNYRVIARNNFGSVTSAVATVTVLASQEIVLAVGSVSAVGGSLTFQVTGPPLADYIISVSPDWVQWTPVLTNSVTQGVLRFQEALESNRSARFYRASLAN